MIVFYNNKLQSWTEYNGTINPIPQMKAEAARKHWGGGRGGGALNFL